MTVEQIKINQLIELEVELNPDNVLHLASRIEGMDNEYIYISVPMYRGEVVPLHIGHNLKIYFTDKDMSFAFVTSVAGRNWQNIPLLVIKKPKKIVKIQRRNFMRLRINLKVKLRTADLDGDFNSGETIDISGGGLLISTAEPVQKGQIFEIELMLPERKSIFCRARVVRILEAAVKPGDKNKVALEYCEISENQRDKIIKFIFTKQRELIRKGLY